MTCIRGAVLAKAIKEMPKPDMRVVAGATLKEGGGGCRRMRTPDQRPPRARPSTVARHQPLPEAHQRVDQPQPHGHLPRPRAVHHPARHQRSSGPSRLGVVNLQTGKIANGPQ